MQTDHAGETGAVMIYRGILTVTRDQTLSYLVANTSPGTVIPIELIRDGKRLTVRATVAARPSEEELQSQVFDPDAKQGADPFGPKPQQRGDGAVEQALGISVIPLTPQIAAQIGASADTRGVVISAVDPNSDAGQKGLTRGDIVLSANYRGTTTLAALEEAIRTARAAGRDALLLRVQRRGQPAAYVPIRLR